MTAGIVGLWVALAISLLALQSVALTRNAVPGMGEVLGFAMRTRPGRWFVLVGWAWLGWHLFVRATG